MEDLKELWAEIKPRNKEERRELLKDLAKFAGLVVIGIALIYFGCLFS